MRIYVCTYDIYVAYGHLNQFCFGWLKAGTNEEVIYLSHHLLSAFFLIIQKRQGCNNTMQIPPNEKKLTKAITIKNSIRRV